MTHKSKKRFDINKDVNKENYNYLEDNSYTYMYVHTYILYIRH